MEPLHRSWASLTDGATCLLLNLAQWRHRRHTCEREALEDYIGRCEAFAKADFYAAPALEPLHETPRLLRWRSPHPSGFAENDTATALLFPCAAGWNAPTVLLLHALMSVNDVGYRLLAARFNALGWNAVFPQLPYHYARKPRGYLNGELAITANLIRNGEGLRQGVTELRQIMAWLRARGCPGFGLFATSYGAWTGALLAELEPDFRFVALMQPIADIEHAIWESPAGRTLRHLLRRRGITTDLTRRHAHLSSPLHCRPAADPARILLVCGAYDRISPPDRIAALASSWGGTAVLTCRQGHFGYAVARETFRAVRNMME